MIRWILLWVWSRTLVTLGVLGRIRHSCAIWTIHYCTVYYPYGPFHCGPYSELWWSDTCLTDSNLVKIRFKYSKIITTHVYHIPYVLGQIGAVIKKCYRVQLLKSLYQMLKLSDSGASLWFSQVFNMFYTDNRLPVRVLWLRDEPGPRKVRVNCV